MCYNNHFKLFYNYVTLLQPLKTILQLRYFTTTALNYHNEHANLLVRPRYYGELNYYYKNYFCDVKLLPWQR